MSAESLHMQMTLYFNQDIQEHCTVQLVFLLSLVFKNLFKNNPIFL